MPQELLEFVYTQPGLSQDRAESAFGQLSLWFGTVSRRYGGAVFRRIMWLPV